VDVNGAPGADDLGFDPDGSIVVSQRVVDVLMRFRIRQATLAQFAPAATPTAPQRLQSRRSAGSSTGTRRQPGS
jgi:hypothetical protein